MRNLLSIIVLTLLLGFASPAIATNPNCDGGNGTLGGQGGAGCETNNYDDYSTTTTNHPVANAGDATSIQGQKQGQIGIVAPEIDTTDFNVNKQGQIGINAQKQTAVGEVDQKVKQEVEDNSFVDASDHSVHSIDNDFPVNTAAPVFAGNCAQGVSAQTGPFGGSVATGNSVCDFIAISGAYVASGNPVEAMRLLSRAEKAAEHRFLFSRIRSFLTLGLL